MSCVMGNLIPKQSKCVCNHFGPHSILSSDGLARRGSSRLGANRLQIIWTAGIANPQGPRLVSWCKGATILRFRRVTTLTLKSFFFLDFLVFLGGFPIFLVFLGQFSFFSKDVRVSAKRKTRFFFVSLIFSTKKKQGLEGQGNFRGAQPSARLSEEMRVLGGLCGCHFEGSVGLCGVHGIFRE